MATLLPVLRHLVLIVVPPSGTITTFTCIAITCTPSLSLRLHFSCSKLSTVSNAALVDWAVTRSGLLALNLLHDIIALHNLQQTQEQPTSSVCVLVDGLAALLKQFVTSTTASTLLFWNCALAAPEPVDCSWQPPPPPKTSPCHSP